MSKKAKIYLVHVYAFTPLMIAVCQRNFIDPSLELQPHQQGQSVYIHSVQMSTEIENDI